MAKLFGVSNKKPAIKCGVLVLLTAMAALTPALGQSPSTREATPAVVHNDAELERTFTCPDSASSFASSRAQLRAFIEQVHAIHPDWGLRETLTLRRRLLATHNCPQTQTGSQALQHGATRQVDVARLPPGTRVLSNVHYGPANTETLDVYAPPRAVQAPVIFMVHGGGWWRGDKASSAVIQHKADHWVPLGFIVISVDYPLLPTPPLQQARGVAKALAVAQREAPGWGANPREFVLMGHSAGAQLVSLISAEPRLATSQGALPWLGTVALDSAAYNVTTMMQGDHLRLYDQAFGTSHATWIANSPIAQLQSGIAPFLAVCSSRRAGSCTQAHAFVNKARGLGSRAQVLPEDMSHGEINAALGMPSRYTAAVDGFLESLSPALAARLKREPQAGKTRTTENTGR